MPRRRAKSKVCTTDWSWEQGGQRERNRRTESGGSARTPEAEDPWSPWRPSALTVGGSQKLDRQTFFNLIIYIISGGWCGSGVDRAGCKARKTAREREGESRQAGDPQVEVRVGQVGRSELFLSCRVGVEGCVVSGQPVM